MKTTLELPDGLYRKLKVTAAEEGRTLTELVRDFLSRGLSRRRTEAKDKKGKYRRPIIPSRQPGTLRLTNAMIEDLLLDVSPEALRK